MESSFSMLLQPFLSPRRRTVVLKGKKKHQGGLVGLLKIVHLPKIGIVKIKTKILWLILCYKKDHHCVTRAGPIQMPFMDEIQQKN